MNVTSGWLDLPVNQAKFVALDVETTGLYPDRGDRICEVAALTLHEGRASRSYHRLINPLRGMSEGARQASGISDEMVDQAPGFDEVALELWERLVGRILVVHNAPFAVGFLRAEMQPLGLPVDQLLAVDTVVLARTLLPGGRTDLDVLEQQLGLSVRCRARALSDTWLISKLFRYAVAQLGSDATVSSLFPRLAEQELRSPDPFGETLLQIEHAMEHRLELDIRYYSPWSASLTLRRIVPLAVRDEYYLDAYCFLRTSLSLCLPAPSSVSSGPRAAGSPLSSVSPLASRNRTGALSTRLPGRRGRGNRPSAISPSVTPCCPGSTWPKISGFR